MIKVDENDPVGEMEPSFPYRDVTIRRGMDMKELYNLEGEIGRGKFGTVYRCREKSTGLTLAAKFVGIARRQDRRNVEREVEIMRTLQHPRLIQLYDSLESENIMCVVLELIEGGELFERVIDDDFILTEKACTVFMRQICEGVAFIHQNNIIHLDLKPENILCLSKTGNRIKIIDFGLARKYEPDKKLQVLFGTPEFVAPEVVNFDEISYATDMWSVGVICYVLLSGLSPFMGETDVETMANVTIARFDYEDECFEEISKDAKNFISNLLVKDKKARLTAFECLSHPWLVRKIPPPPPSLETTKENLKQFVDKSLPMFRNHLFPRNEISNNKFGTVQSIIENGDKNHTPSKNEKIPLVKTFNLINKQNDTNDINKFNELMKNDSVIKFPTELSKIMGESNFLDENDLKNDGFSTPEVSYKPSSQPINIPNKNKNFTGEIEQFPIIPTNEIPNIEKLISKQKDIKMISPEKHLSEKEIFHRCKCTTDVIPKENSFPKIENISENSTFTENSNSPILRKDEINGIQNNISEIKPLDLLSNSNLNSQYDFNKKDELTKVVKSKFLDILDDENCALPTSSRNAIQNSSFLLPNDNNLMKNLPRGVEQTKNFPENLFGIKENTNLKNESISFKQHLRSTPPWFSELKTPAIENCKIDRFDRRSSDFSCFLNSKDDSESVSLADEIRKLSTRLLQISNSQTETENSVNNNPNPRSNDPISSFLANHGISNHRPKFKFSCMNRDVPIGSPPPPTNIAYYLNKSLNPNLDSHSAPQTPRRSPENSSNFMNKNVNIASEFFQCSDVKNTTASTETKKTISQKSVLPLIRMTGKDALEHKWLKEAACETALSKTKLKRYVIKRRWIKAVNTIIALQRMGAKLEQDD